jgi:AcrR family transcriptional regulator
MPRANRRDDLLVAALDLFVDRGYEGTSVADLAEATSMSKAAFVYHFGSKEELLFELAEPFLDELDGVLDRHEGRPARQSDLEEALGDYLGVLHRHRDIVRWIDGDKSVLNHGDLGGRLDANNRRAHHLLAGNRPSRTNRALASSVLGMLWRPVRNGYLPDDARSRRAVVQLATRAAEGL